jgi:hypothetical protein
MSMQSRSDDINTQDPGPVVWRIVANELYDELLKQRKVVIHLIKCSQETNRILLHLAGRVKELEDQIANLEHDNEGGYGYPGGIV